MKILYWTPLFWPDTGGIETLAIRLLPALRARGYEIIAVTSHGRFDLPDKAYYNDIPVYRFHILSALAENNLSRMISTLRQISSLKQAYRPDLVHISFGAPSIVYFHLKTADVHPAPTLVTINQNLAGSTTGPDTLLGEILQKADWIASDSEATLNEARRICPIIFGRSSVIYNGVERPKLEPTPLSFDTPHVVCLGRLAEEKGFDLAIAAFAQLVKRFPNARLTVAGDGPARSDLEQQAREHGLCDCIDFPGRIAHEEIPALLNTATVVVIPSRVAESFPVAALEAAQMARPVVAARGGGLPESVVHQQTGLLVERDDSAALTGAIAFLLDNPERARQMGQAGRARALDLFDWDKYVDAYDMLYRKLIRGPDDAQAAIRG